MLALPKKDDSAEAISGSFFRLTRNRLGFGCFFILGLTIVILFLDIVPQKYFLRYELEYELRRPARSTIKTAGPSVIPVIIEYMSHQKFEKQMIAISVAGDYIEFHPRTSENLVTELCRKALKDQRLRVRTHAITTLRKVKGHSDDVDNTILKLISSNDEETRNATLELLLSRLDVSNVVCKCKNDILRYINDQDIHLYYENSKLKIILDKCEQSINQ